LVEALTRPRTSHLALSGRPGAARRGCCRADVRTSGQPQAAWGGRVGRRRPLPPRRAAFRMPSLALRGGRAAAPPSALPRGGGIGRGAAERLCPLAVVLHRVRTGRNTELPRRRGRPGAHPLCPQRQELVHEPLLGAGSTRTYLLRGRLHHGGRRGAESGRTTSSVAGAHARRGLAQLQDCHIWVHAVLCTDLCEQPRLLPSPLCKDPVQLGQLRRIFPLVYTADQTAILLRRGHG
jgi:hypothetical protein